MKKVIVILGPTGVGKTKLSIEIAKKINGSIISGDSIQVYRGINIGSGKIKEEEKQGIPHYLIDILDYGSGFSAFDFQNQARDLIEKLDNPIIVGGTGLYIDAAIRDYSFVGPSRDEAFDQKYAHLSNEELFEYLKSVDPNIENIHMNNRKRVLRALEMALNSTSITKSKNGHQLIYDCLILGLTMEREKLYSRINSRVDEMVNEGLIDEAKALYDKGTMVDAIGYKELNQYFMGNCSKEEAIEEIKKNSRHYAKRQMTWFRHHDDITIVDVLSTSVSECVELVNNFIKEK